MRTLRWSVLAIVGVLPTIAACEDRDLPPRGQLLLYLDTDAPLALAPGARADTDAPFGLFDRVRVETLLLDGTPACAACARDFSVNRDELAKRTLSVGLLPGGQSSLMVRVRLFRATAAPGGTPRESATIDRTFGVPGIPDEGIVEATAFLPVEAVGLGPSEGALPLRDGPPGPVALHAAMSPSPCTTTGQAGEVCLRGLAFWMSDPRVGVLSTSGEQVPERLVVLSPFWIDDREVTVAQLRASGLVTSATEPKRFEEDPKCTYSTAAGPRDDLPANCLVWATANRYCEAKGARLPTEAEQEALLGGREGRRYVWGEDNPTCDDAVLARRDPSSVSSDDPAPTTCSRLGVGPRPAGAGRRDVIEIGGRRIFDIAGNVAEYGADVATELNATCRGRGFTRDPLCTSGSSSHVVRGASWSIGAFGARSTVHLSARDTSSAFDVGFRCARSGR